MRILNPQIFITAVATMIIAAIMWGGYFYAVGPKKKYLFQCLVLMLPFSAAVNFLVKRPLNAIVLSTFQLQPKIDLSQPVLYLFFIAFLAPVTEELVKIAILVFPNFRQKIREDSFWVGIWLGLGFGLGEALYLAFGISRSQQFIGLSWYMFGGYFGERLVVCLLHAILTGIFIWFIHQNKFFLGYLIVIFLHAFINIGAIFLGLEMISTGVATLSLYLSLLILIFLFELIRKKWIKSQSDLEKEQDVIYFRRGN